MSLVPYIQELLIRENKKQKIKLPNFLLWSNSGRNVKGTNDHLNTRENKPKRGDT